MTLDVVYKVVFYYANKDQKGDRLSPDELNNGIFENTDTILQNKILGIELPKQITSQVLVEINQVITDKAKRYKTIMGEGIVPPLPVQNGIAQIPTDYLYPSSLSFLNKDRIKTIEVLNDASYESRLDDPLAPPTIDYPIANFQNGFIRIAPFQVNRINFIYYRKPITAYFDYYISPTLGVQYMPPTTTHTLLAGELYPRTNTTTGTVTSVSVELDFDVDMHNDYVKELLKVMSINLRDAELMQGIG